jgi:predicted dehydrogenase
MKHLRWGLIGAGNIAVKFARGLNSTEEATALAIGSRSLDKARKFAEAHKVERACGSYDEVLADSEVDAVYIALPNHLHAEWSIKSAQAGKHVLCEKPVTMNAAELEQVLAVVREQGVFFMEAFMYRCHPQWEKVREIIAAGSIGDVRVLHSAFAFDMGANFENTRMSNPMGGGGLLDVGSYCVSFARMIAGEEPEEVRAVAHIGERSRVDEWMTGLLKFPSGLTAYFTSGIRCEVPPAADIYGSEGSIRITAPWQPTEENAFVIVNAGGKTEEFQIKSGRDLYENEALHVAEHLDDRQAPAMNWEDSLGQVRTIDALRADMGLVWDQEKGA